MYGMKSPGEYYMIIQNMGERFYQYFDDNLKKRFMIMEGNSWQKAKQLLNKFNEVANALPIQWFILLAENIGTVSNQIKEKCWNANDTGKLINEIDYKEEKYNEFRVENTYIPDIPEDIYGVMF